MIWIKKNLGKLFLIMVLILFWYMLRWYFVVPRTQYLGKYSMSKDYSIKIYKIVNYDAVLFYYDFSLSTGEKDTKRKRFFLSHDNLNFSDFNFRKKDGYISILLTNNPQELVDTLAVLDLTGNIIENNMYHDSSK